MDEWLSLTAAAARLGWRSRAGIYRAIAHGDLRDRHTTGSVPVRRGRPRTHEVCADDVERLRRTRIQRLADEVRRLHHESTTEESQ